MSIHLTRPGTARVPFYKFDSFLRLSGFFNVINPRNWDSNNGIEIYGSNSKVTISGGDLGLTNSNDILVDPAAANVEISAVGLRSDPSKVSFPATTRFIAGGVRSDGDGYFADVVELVDHDRLKICCLKRREGSSVLGG